MGRKQICLLQFFVQIELIRKNEEEKADKIECYRKGKIRYHGKRAF